MSGGFLFAILATRSVCLQPSPLLLFVWRERYPASPDATTVDEEVPCGCAICAETSVVTPRYGSPKNIGALGDG